jgi:2-C-methyl-D-erythritol 4-phosphate cytidylyltransferase
LSRLAAVVVAAGSSTRWSGLRAGLPKKEYHSLGGKPVLAHAASPFLELDPALLLIIAVPGDHVREAAALLGPFLPLERVRFVAGGPTRQQSVRLGLEELEAEHPEEVLVHDGARPWVSVGLIARVLEASRRYGACIPLSELGEAPKRVGPSGFILEDLKRSQIRTAQTPQGFAYPRILAAHRRAWGEGRHFIDDAGVYSAYCGPVFTVPGERSNRKITFREDLP